jgi:ABC-type glycerol-3-phosphate transport system substrate-binding protein
MFNKGGIIMYSKFRKPLSLVLVIVMCFGIFGCSPKEEVKTSPTPSNSDNQQSEDDQEPEATDDPNKLDLYVSELTGDHLKIILSRKRWPDTLNIKVFNNAKDLETQLLPELTAGKGPDIFIFNSTTLPNFRNYMKQGVFADLNEMIEADTSVDRINLEDYNAAALETGMWQDQRCFIPLAYLPDFFITTKEMCDKYDITIPEDGIAYGEMPVVFKNYIEQERTH